MSDKIQDESTAYFYYNNEFQQRKTLIIKQNDDGELYIDLPRDILETLQWDEDTELEWSERENGAWILTKKEKNMTWNVMDNQKDVTEFMAAADQYVGTTPHLNDKNEQQARLYIDLIDEEFRELCDGFLRRHIGDIADGGADLVWVIQGLFTTLGIDFNKVWEEVRASNMSKVSDNGKIKKRQDGKILKPESYFKPDIDRVLKDQGL